MNKILVYYYALMIFFFVTVVIIVWLLAYIRKIKTGSAGDLKKEEISSSNFLKKLGLDTPDLGIKKKIARGIANKVFLEEIQQESESEPKEAELSVDEIKEQIRLIPKKFKRVLETTDLKVILSKVAVKDIMLHQIVTIKEDAHFSDVPKLMEKFYIKHLPVVDYSNRLVGLLTQKILYKIKSPRRLADGEWYYDDEMLNNIILKHVMKKKMFTLPPDALLGEAITKMVYHKYSCVMIIDGARKLLGILTRSDILRMAVHIYAEK